MFTDFQNKIIAETTAFVKSLSTGEASGHDWWHIYRVTKLANYLAKEEKANLFMVHLAALLHDVDDWKFNNPDSKNAENWLRKCELDEESIQYILHIIQQVSFKGAGENTMPDSINAKVVQDADRLDAIGAIGIARAFAFGGAHQRPMYEPEVMPEFHEDFKAYKEKQSHTLNHFYEKLLLLKNRLHTQSAIQLAEKRHHFMELFLENFLKEWFVFEKSSY